MGKDKGPAQTKKGEAKGKGAVEEKEKGVDSMEVRHILVEKMGACLCSATREHTIDKERVLKL